MFKLGFLYIAITIFAPVLCHDDDVYTIQYNTENFSEEMPKRNHFIMFYAPWYVRMVYISAIMLNITFVGVDIVKD